MSYPEGYDYAPYPFPQPVGVPPRQRPARCEILRVAGRRGAEALQLGPNSSALALDETAPLVWCIQTDSAGVKTLTPYTITLYAEPVPMSMDELGERLSRLEAMLSAKSDPEPAKPAAAQGGKQRRAEPAADA